MSDISVASLHVYPVKGCRGLAPPVALVTSTGLSTQGAADREWMVVEASGRFVTQRELPQLALVAVAAAAAGLTLHAPGVAALTVPYGNAGTTMEVEVWRHQGRGLDAGDAAAAWLSTWLGTPVRLVRFDRATPRACNPEYVGAAGAHTFFADGYPILVIGTASLADLNARLAARGIGALPMNRFRPNVVLEGLPAYGEDHLDTITIGDVTLRCVKPCTRCSVTTTDQTTAQVGLEPLRTLGGYRMDERLGGVTFGMNAVVARGAGHDIACGATVSVDHRF
jgi:uncharacterized protein